jgi:hypothetical protein
VIETRNLETALSGQIPKGEAFHPSEIELDECAGTSQRDDVSEGNEMTVGEKWQKEVRPLTPKYPTESDVLAIDSTGFILGYMSEGVVGTLRASVVTKRAGESRRKLELYGPYLIAITNANKESIYQNLYRTVYGEPVVSPVPDLANIIDRMRNIFERHIELEVARRSRNSLILLDGSLIGSAIANPASFVKKIINNAARNGNSIAAISKSTGLVLRRSRRSILSLLEGVAGPCYAGSIKNHVEQNPERYFGDIYVGRLTPCGEPFRIDLPHNVPQPHEELLNALSGLAGDYGYPEELKLAHMTCVLSGIEALELQAVAISLHGLVTKEEADIRPRLFPL